MRVQGRALQNQFNSDILAHIGQAPPIGSSFPLAGMRRTPRCRSNFQQFVGKFATFQSTGRKMVRKDVAAPFDRGDEAFSRSAGLDLRDQSLDGVIPDVRCNLFIDPGVCDDLGIAFARGGKDQHAGTVFGFVQTLCGELAHRLGVSPIMSSPPGNNMETQTRNRKKQDDEKKDCDLRQVNDPEGPMGQKDHR